MSLRQVTSVPFPYRDSVSVNTTKTFDSVYYEFERTTFLHGLSVFCEQDMTVDVKISFPSTFTHGGELSNGIFIFTGTVGTAGLFLAPGAVSFGANAPLPAAFPQGSILEVVISYQENPGEAQVFLVASA